MSVCGLWQGTQRLIAVIADDDGELRPPITVAATRDNAHHLLTHLATAGIAALVIAESNHILIAQAHALNLHLRLVPHDLLDAIRTATGLNQRPLRNTAILLARWYLTPRPTPAPPRLLGTGTATKAARFVLMLRLAFRHRPTLAHRVALSETTLSKPRELP